MLRGEIFQTFESNERPAAREYTAADRPLSFAVEGLRGETQFVKAYGATSSCTGIYPSREREQLKLLPTTGAKPKLLPEARVTETIGSTARHKPCSAKTPGSRSISSPAIQPVLVTHTQRATLKSGGSHPNTFCADYFQSRKVSRSMPLSCRLAALRSGLNTKRRSANTTPSLGLDDLPNNAGEGEC